MSYSTACKFSVSCILYKHNTVMGCWCVWINICPRQMCFVRFSPAIPAKFIDKFLIVYSILLNCKKSLLRNIYILSFDVIATSC